MDKNKYKIKPTWIIIHKETGEQWQASSGKQSWGASNHAKSAWRASANYHGKGGGTFFDEQDTHELLELESEDTVKLKEALEIMEELVEWASCGDHNLNTTNRAIDFLRENK